MFSRDVYPCKGDSDLSYLNNSLLTVPTLIVHNKSTSYDELLTTANMVSLYCRHVHQALILLLKCVRNGPDKNDSKTTNMLESKKGANFSIVFTYFWLA